MSILAFNTVYASKAPTARQPPSRIPGDSFLFMHAPGSDLRKIRDVPTTFGGLKVSEGLLTQ